MTHRNASASYSRGSTTGPQTPSRNQSQNYGSPSVLRAEEECIVIELGSRYLRAGLAGFALPQAVVDFGPEQQRRAGDFRRWAADYNGSSHTRPSRDHWGKEYELWPLDLREVNLGLVGDKIERALREAFTKVLLIDSRPRRMLLVVPSLLPLPLLFTVLETLFSNFQPPNISLVSTPVLTALATGLRSALVVDIGWAETTVSGLYEFREVQSYRSIRASKMLGEALFSKIARILSKHSPEKTSDTSKAEISFEECEEILERLVWCKSMKKQTKPQKADHPSTTVAEGDELDPSLKISSSVENDVNELIKLSLNSLRPPRTIQIPFSEFAEPCEVALFATGTPESEFDDEELPLHLLVYKSLLKLPLDVRATCMARIVFVGGASQIPGLKTRVMQELSSLIQNRGWNPVSGKVVSQRTKNLRLRKTQVYQKQPIDVLQTNNAPLATATSACSMPQETDPILEKLIRDSRKDQPTIEAGKLRAVNSLGAWSGGSLMSLMKIQATSVIEKEQWAQNGTLRFSRISEGITSQRQSMGPTALRSVTEERSSWALDLWGC